MKSRSFNVRAGADVRVHVHVHVHVHGHEHVHAACACACSMHMCMSPSGFNVRTGEFVKILVPWLHSSAEDGGKPLAEQWHAFSIYMEENTQEGM